MPTEIRELLHRSVTTEAAPTAHILERAQRIRSRRRRARATSLVVAVLAIAAVIAVIEQDPSTVVVGVEEVLVPPEGVVRAEWLADGSPVFVTNFDGSVRVFAAFSTHTPFGLREPISWCASAAQFEDWMHGSWWDKDGRKIDGPAPSDLWEYEVVSVDADRVRVGNLRVATEMSSSVRTDEPCERGETPGAALVHDYAARPSYDLASALDQQPAGLVVIDNSSVVLGSFGARLCDDDLRCVDVRGSTPTDKVSWDTRVLARVADDAVYDVRVLDGFPAREGVISCDEASNPRCTTSSSLATGARARVAQ